MALLPQVGSSDLRWLLGMLTQPEEGKYFLEDLVTRLPLDLSNAVGSLSLIHI